MLRLSAEIKGCSGIEFEPLVYPRQREGSGLRVGHVYFSVFSRVKGKRDWPGATAGLARVGTIQLTLELAGM